MWLDVKTLFCPTSGQKSVSNTESFFVQLSDKKASKIRISYKHYSFDEFLLLKMSQPGKATTNFLPGDLRVAAPLGVSPLGNSSLQSINGTASGGSRVRVNDGRSCFADEGKRFLRKRGYAAFNEASAARDKENMLIERDLERIHREGLEERPRKTFPTKEETDAIIRSHQEKTRQEKERADRLRVMANERQMIPHAQATKPGKRSKPIRVIPNGPKRAKGS